MELTPEHLQSEHLDPLPLFQSEEATLWHIDTTHPDVVADDHVSARLATATIWSLDEDRTYALLCSGRSIRGVTKRSPNYCAISLPIYTDRIRP